MRPSTCATRPSFKRPLHALTTAYNLSQAFAGQRVGVKQVEEKIWLVSFMRYDLGFFDHETCRIESAANPCAAKVLPMSPAPCVRVVVASSHNH